MISVITAFGEQVTVLQGQVEPHYGQHPDAEMSLSRPGPGPVPGAGVLSGSGADPHRYAFAGARRNRAAACPITRQPGKKIVLAWYGHSGWLTGTLMARAFAALTVSPGAAACCHDVRARGIEHDDVLRRLAGILRACLKTRTLYREATAWSHCLEKLAA